METVIANFYQLSRMDGKFNDDPKTARLIMENAKVTMNHLNRINDNCGSCGKLYVIDEDATKQWRKEHKEWRDTRREMDKVATDGAIQLIKGVQAITQQKTAVKAPISIPGGEPNGEWTKQQLQKYCDDNEISYKKTLGAGKLLELINV